MILLISEIDGFGVPGWIFLDRGTNPCVSPAFMAVGDLEIMEICIYFADLCPDLLFGLKI